MQGVLTDICLQYLDIPLKPFFQCYCAKLICCGVLGLRLELQLFTPTSRATFHPFLLSCPLVNLTHSSAAISDTMRKTTQFFAGATSNHPQYSFFLFPLKGSLPPPLTLFSSAPVKYLPSFSLSSTTRVWKL